MYDIEEHTELEPEGRRLLPESDSDTVYAQLPFDPEGLVFEYPPDTLKDQIKTDGWYELLKAQAGESGEVTGKVYSHETFYHTVGLLYFEDPDREVGMVADGDVLRQVTANFVQYGDWHVVSTDVNLDEFLYEAVTEFFDNTV